VLELLRLARSPARRRGCGRASKLAGDGWSRRIASCAWRCSVVIVVSLSIILAPGHLGGWALEYTHEHEQRVKIAS
jgi:hypothetical protein